MTRARPVEDGRPRPPRNARRRRPGSSASRCACWCNDVLAAPVRAARCATRGRAAGLDGSNACRPRLESCRGQAEQARIRFDKTAFQRGCGDEGGSAAHVGDPARQAAEVARSDLAVRLGNDHRGGLDTELFRDDRPHQRAECRRRPRADSHPGARSRPRPLVRVIRAGVRGTPLREDAVLVRRRTRPRHPCGPPPARLLGTHRSLQPKASAPRCEALADTRVAQRDRGQRVRVAGLHEVPDAETPRGRCRAGSPRSK